MTLPSFSAIDVETANADPASICEIGIVQVQSGDLVARWSTLVNPNVAFNELNIAIHGITEDRVTDCPTISQLHADLGRLLRGQVVVSHTAFDRIALEGAMLRHNVPVLELVWLDSAAIARRAWPERFDRRWSLAAVAGQLGIEFQHHRAVEDARAAAEIVLQACAQSGLGIEDWLHCTAQGR